MPDWIDYTLGDDFVTKGQKRPALVLRHNDDGTDDVLVFFHPEDRQPDVSAQALRVKRESAPAPSPAPAAGEHTPDASARAANDAPGASEPRPAGAPEPPPRGATPPALGNPGGF
jgi:hypothetical protein